MKRLILLAVLVLMGCGDYPPPDTICTNYKTMSYYTHTPGSGVHGWDGPYTKLVCVSSSKDFK